MVSKIQASRMKRVQTGGHMKVTRQEVDILALNYEVSEYGNNWLHRVERIRDDRLP